MLNQICWVLLKELLQIKIVQLLYLVKVIKKKLKIELLKLKFKWNLQPVNMIMIDYKKDQLEQTGGVAVIYVGAASEVELKEKKDRFEDALKSELQRAVDEGIIPGGGVGYLMAIKSLEWFKC